jgi:Na+-transporting methylmalonyl-CoA/oxaloacetate decarboxylase gamma subunit
MDAQTEILWGELISQSKERLALKEEIRELKRELKKAKQQAADERAKLVAIIDAAMAVNHGH